MNEPITNAGRRLVEERVCPECEFDYSTAVTPLVLAIEAEAAEKHEAALRERGWRDEYEVATDAAMNHGNGMAEARALPPDPERLARAYGLLMTRSDPVLFDPDATAAAIIAAWSKGVDNAQDEQR